MTKIYRIPTGQVEGNGANDTNTSEIRPYGEIAVYVGDNNKLELLMFDGVRTHVRSKVLNKGTFYGGDADSADGAGYDSIKLVPDEELRRNGSQQYIIVEPTGGEPGHVHIRAGGTIDSSTADLFLGGELNHVRVSDTSNIVTISADANDNGATRNWLFDGNGILSVPAINNESLFIQGAEIGSTTSGIGITATNGITLTTDALGTAKFWQFGTDGNLTLPAGFIRSTQITGLNLASNYDVHILADYTDNNHEWIFEASTAELTVPGAIKSKTNSPTGTQVTNLPYTLGAGAANGYVGLGSEWNAVIALGDLTGYTLTAQQTGSTIFTTTITQMRDNLGGQPAFQTADGLPGYSADITFTLTSPDYAPQTIDDLELAAGTNTWTFGVNGNLTVPGNIKAIGTIDGNGVGNGNNLTVQAGETTTGDGGDLTVHAGDTVTGVGGDLTVRSGAATTGNAGVLNVRASDTVSGDGGMLNVRAGDAVTGDAGDIDIRAGDTITGDGGSITITAGSTVNSGPGGSVTITSGSNTNGAAGDINLVAATSSSGADGAISISTSTSSLILNNSGLTIGSENAINIDVNLSDSTLRRWTFTEGGDLRFPDGTTQTTAFTGPTVVNASFSITDASFTPGFDYAATPYSITVTPSSTSAPVSVTFNLSIVANTGEEDAGYRFKIYVNGSAVDSSELINFIDDSPASYSTYPATYTFNFVPGTNSPTTIALWARKNGSNGWKFSKALPSKHVVTALVF
jgi:hypothetical protein